MLHSCILACLFTQYTDDVKQTHLIVHRLRGTLVSSVCFSREKKKSHVSSHGVDGSIQTPPTYHILAGIRWLHKILHIVTVSDFIFEAIHILFTTHEVDVGFASWLRTDVRPPGLGCCHLARLPIRAIANHWRPLLQDGIFPGHLNILSVCSETNKHPELRLGSWVHPVPGRISQRQQTSPHLVLVNAFCCPQSCRPACCGFRVVLMSPATCFYISNALL